MYEMQCTDCFMFDCGHKLFEKGHIEINECGKTS